MITVTVESIEQAEQLLDLAIDYIQIGDEDFALRLPYHFSREEIRQLTEMAHAKHKKVRVAVNAIMHTEQMRQILDYLQFLEEIKVDMILVGDTGVIHVINKEQLNLPYIYDAATMVTSSRQINFWADRGAKAAVLAREIPFQELEEMAPSLKVPAEVLVYGATCIHQSKRPLVENYLSFIQLEQDKSKAANLFISEPKEETTHYSIYEDAHGTHIFATNDINLMAETKQLFDTGFRWWFLDGIYTPGAAYVSIVQLFIEAMTLLQNGQATNALLLQLSEQVCEHHPDHRTLDQGFYYLNPDEIK